MAPKLIAFIGASGAQGLPIARDLANSGLYNLRALTRDPNSQRFKDLQSSVPNLPGRMGAFMDIDGFNCGEKTEIYWSIRAYELEIEEGVKFFVFSSLVYSYKVSGFRPEFRCGHIDAKGRVAEFIISQNDEVRRKHGMSAALFSTGPYMEMTIGAETPLSPTVEDGVVTWKMPLGDSATHASCSGRLAAAFENVTGKGARYVNVSFDEYFSGQALAELLAGYNADPSDPATMTFRQNFTGWWNLFRHSPDNNGVYRKEYALLDKVHPGRIRTAEEWFRREDQRGREKGLGSLWERVQPENIQQVLKVQDDSHKGAL
ncbi:NmrA-like family protein [Diaporthe eres]|nr:NmrA-like family protein [Diaporthe eres]